MLGQFFYKTKSIACSTHTKLTETKKPCSIPGDNDRFVIDFVRKKNRNGWFAIRLKGLKIRTEHFEHITLSVTYENIEFNGNRL